MPPNLAPDLELLINRYIDGQMTGQEMQLLDERLRIDSDARRCFARKLNLESALDEAADRTAGEQAAVDDIVALNRRALHSKALALCALSASAAVMLAAGIWWWRAAPQTYATVIRCVGNQSLANGAPLGDGAPLANQLTHMQSGSLELVSIHGARIVIEAPAEFYFETGQRLNLARGRLSAFVPPAAKGFTVVTPSGDAIDLGTKFAVDVASLTETEVHVFEGEVLARPKGGQHLKRLTANSAIRFRQATPAEACDVRHGTFVTAREMIPLSEALRCGQSERARRACQALKQDPTVLAWLDFDRPPATSNLDAARIEYGAVVHGARWVQGRFPGTGALDFVHSDDCVQLNLNARVSQFTLMTWIRLNQLEGRHNSLYSTDKWGQLGQVHWMIGSVDNVRFAIKGPNPDLRGNSNVWLETEPKSMTELEHWVHLALVYDSQAGRAIQLLNGRVVATAVMPKGLIASLGPAQLGNWQPQEHKANEPRRLLSGRMDEFVAFSRALSSDELGAYYEATKPYN